MATLLSLPAMSDEIKDNSDNYIGGYQSYFHDDVDTPKSARAADGKPASSAPGNAPSVTTASNGATASAGVSSTPAAAPGSVPDKGGVLLSNANEVSVLRLRQDEPPVHWNSVGRNMEAGGLHGNIGTQIEIDDARRSNNEHNGGKFKYATLQAFLRHDEMPNWYFGFYNAREDSYKGQFSNQHYGGTNTINEVFVGHIFETWRGNIGAEVMGGSESAGKRWKSRFKLWQDLRLSDRWSIAGYAFGEFQPQGTEPGNGDLEKLIFETEPALQYRVNPDLGLYLRPFYSYNRQEREQWGDIIEREWKVSAGLWKNWYPLLTSLYVGVGQKKTTNASDSYELFYDGRYQYVGGTLSYPIVDELRLYGEFKAKFTKEAGAWTTGGYSWTPFTVVGAVYNF
ncbi:OmpG porin family protein [Erwinia sp. JUb26]|uniref:OmpG porin family protein n=1 Tax=Erwinia sp. JUb26 TaxID=2485126 RepID=UPI001F4804A5|nr:OmpG porin family protein [Erwinia sp. JUb26]